MGEKKQKGNNFSPCTGQPLPHKAALAPAPVSHYFSHARALTALDETETGDCSLLRAAPQQRGRASSGFGCVTADKTACHGCVGQGRATTACCSLPAHTVAHRWSSLNQVGGSCAYECFHAKCHHGSGAQWGSAEAGHS